MSKNRPTPEEDQVIDGDCELQSTETAPPDPDQPVVVGIGASAGGLSALIELLDNLPEDPGMAFVIIQHLDPTHASSLVEILSKRTDLPIEQVDRPTLIADNHIYVIPPGQYLAIEDCRLMLSEPKDPRGSRMAIDYFFSSLAEDSCEYAIGVVLSGTGSDGTAGLRDIKHYGGLTVVQQPEDAEHSGMPQSAIDSVHIDYVLPAAAIGPRLKQYVDFCGRHGPLSAQAAYREEDTDLTPILTLLRQETKQDFRRYRKNTLIRRVRRRMGLMQLENLSDYASVLADNPAEREALRRDLLIGVTRFFRDPAAWAVLEDNLPSLVQRASRRAPLRVWSAGCATGEEAYTAAMLLLEQTEAAAHRPPVQIFATDIADDALLSARAGLYPEAIANDVSPERLRQFFKKEPGGYRISSQVRESVVFANQNVLAQPPFAKLDLVLCRNLLIYLERDAQDRVMDVFQFALREGGLLFLGNTESIGRTQDVFGVVSKKHRLFRRTSTGSWPPVDGGYESNQQPPATQPARPQTLARSLRRRSGLAACVQRQLLQQLERAVAVVNEEGKMLYIDGQADLYLQHSTGELSAALPDLLDVARRGIKAKLRSAVRQVWKTGDPAQAEGNIQRDGEFFSCELQVSRLVGRPEEEPALLIVFTPRQPAAPEQPSQTAPPDEADLQDAIASEQSFMELEHELATTREQLSSSIAELESANEELKASNEEAMTMNEELQSSNEELETSKEELQSLNEELTTLNSQLERKVDELQQSTDDLENFITSSDVPTVFLDQQFRIRRYTPSCGKLFHFIAGDIGRPLADITPQFTDPDLLQDAEAVLRDLQPRERRVRHAAGDRWYLRRTLPYRTDDDRIQGVVITMTDVTDLRAAQQEAEHQLAQNENIYASAPVGLGYVDAELRYVSVNERLAEINGLSVEQHRGKRVQEVLPSPLATEVAGRLRHILATGELLLDEELTGRTNATDSQRTYLLSYVPLTQSDGRATGVNIVVQDITDRKRWETELQDREAYLRRVLDNQLAFVALLDPDGTTLEVNQSALERAGVARQDALGVPFWDQPWWTFSEESANRAKADFQKARDGATIRRDTQVRTADGTLLQIDYMLSPVLDDQGELLHLIASAVDISERKQAEKRLLGSEKRYRALIDATAEIVWTTDPNGQTKEDSPSWRAYTGQTYDQWKGDGWLDAIHPDDREATAQAWRSALDRKAVYKVEYRLRHRDGGYRWTSARSIPVLSEEGAVREWVGLNVDVQAQKDAQEVVKKSENRMSKAMEAAKAGSWEATPSTGDFRASELALQIYGLSPDAALTHQQALEMVHAEDRQRVQDAVRRTLETGEPFYVEMRIPWADGSIRWVVSHAEVEPGSAPTRLMGFVQDITQRKHAELALQASERRLAAALEGGKMGLWEWDVRRDRCVWNDREYELLGLEPRGEEVPTSLFFERVHPDDAAEFDRILKKVMREGSDFYHELRINLADGGVRWIAAAGRLDRDQLGKPLRVVGVNYDITDQKLAAEALRESDRRKDEFLATLAHELRNPLAPLRSGLEIMRNATEEPQLAAETRQTMERQLSHLVAMVDDLLDVSRITKGKLKLRNEDVRLSDVIQDAVEVCRPAVQQAGHELIVNEPANDALLRGDPHRLPQILSNLINNSVKYTPAGGRIVVSGRTEGRQAVLAVEDNGIGIGEDQLGKVFEMFTQIDKPDAIGYAGLGIGLSLVKSLVQMHGGAISAASAGVGRGALFTVRLPLADDAAPPVPREAEATERQTAPPRQTRRILIADDNEAAAKTLSIVVKRWGNDVRTVSDGKEAVAAAEDFRPQMIIMDIGMPVMDGYAAARQIRSQPWGQAIVMAALTGWGQEEDLQKSREAGFDHHLVKPVEARSLRTIIEGLSPEPENQ